MLFSEIHVKCYSGKNHAKAKEILFDFFLNMSQNMS